MITVSFTDINNHDFNEAVEIIDRTSSLSVKTMCSFNKFKKAYDAEKIRARDLFTKIIEKYTEMETVTEDGKIVTKPKVKIVNGKEARSFTDEAAMDADAKELLNETFSVGIHPLPVQDLGACKLTPRQIRAIAPLLTSDEEVSPGPKLVKDR